MVRNYLKRNIENVNSTQRCKIEQAIQEWFDEWVVAWDAVLSKVSECSQNCPACKSDETGYKDPLHTFFLCMDSGVQESKQRFMEHVGVGHNASPMQALKDPRFFPIALDHVARVYHRRKQEVYSQERGQCPRSAGELERGSLQWNATEVKAMIKAEKAIYTTTVWVFVLTVS